MTEAIDTIQEQVKIIPKDLFDNGINPTSLVRCYVSSDLTGARQ